MRSHITGLATLMVVCWWFDSEERRRYDGGMDIEDMNLEFVQSDLEEYGMFHERDVLKERLNTLESNITSVTKSIDDFVVPLLESNSLSEDSYNHLVGAVDFWEESVEEIEVFIRHARASVKWSGREVLNKSYVRGLLKEDRYGFLKTLKPSDTDRAVGPEYEMLVTVNKFAGVSQSLGWVLLSHFMLDELEWNMDKHYFPSVMNMIRSGVGDKVEDFAELVKKNRLASWKRRFE